MNDLINRLQRTKMLLAAAGLTAGGIALVTFDRYIASNDLTDDWYGYLPWNELGGILIGAALLGIWIDHLFQKERQAADEIRLRQILTEHAPTMRDAVLDAFAAGHDDLKRVATPATLSSITTNSLSLLLDDEQFASEVFTDIESQAVNAAERWRDLDIDITLGPVADHPDLYSVTVRQEYETIPAFEGRRFVCTSDKDDYRALSGGGDATLPWFFKAKAGVTASDKLAFELLSLSVNGESRRVRRASRKHYQAYTADLGEEAMNLSRPVRISQTWRTVVNRAGPILYMDVQRPTQNLAINLDYTATAIEPENLSAIDLVPATRPTRIERSPAEAGVKTLRVEVDGWTFPRSGVAFAWRAVRSELL